MGAGMNHYIYFPALMGHHLHCLLSYVLNLVPVFSVIALFAAREPNQSLFFCHRYKWISPWFLVSGILSHLGQAFWAGTAAYLLESSHRGISWLDF